MEFWTTTFKWKSLAKIEKIGQGNGFLDPDKRAKAAAYAKKDIYLFSKWHESKTTLLAWGSKAD